MDDKKTHDVLVDFDPLRVTLPGAGPFAGQVRIMLPEHHVKLVDLSMGVPMMDGAHIGGDGRLWSFNIDVPEPGMTVGEVTQFVADAEDKLKKLHALIQAELDKKFALEGGKK